MKIFLFIILTFLFLTSCTEEFDDAQMKEVDELKQFYLSKNKLIAKKMLFNLESTVIGYGLRQNDVKFFKDAQAINSLLAVDSISDLSKADSLYLIYTSYFPEDSGLLIFDNRKFSELQRYNRLIKGLEKYTRKLSTDFNCWNTISVGVFQSMLDNNSFKVAAVISGCNEGMSHFQDGSNVLTFLSNNEVQQIPVDWKLLKTVPLTFEDLPDE